MAEFSNFECLLKAPSKQQLNELCLKAFQYRKYSCKLIPNDIVSNTCTLLSVSQDEARKCVCALGELFKAALFQGSPEPQSLLPLFAKDFHKSLRELLATVIIENMDQWKLEAINNHSTVPKLVDFDWRVDTKTSSDTVARMAVPTCLLNLQIQESPVSLSTSPATSCVNVELSKETLATMLDGLGKIRDQLASVANTGR